VYWVGRYKLAFEKFRHTATTHTERYPLEIKSLSKRNLRQHAVAGRSRRRRGRFGLRCADMEVVSDGAWVGVLLSGM